ncbi:hypothetical protein LJC08_02020 [Methanimicrococcus sp. OttesenSCG-928-J09]|nr:hypothetical protein [Methanimicrococcus sp. OttesenSCG-928-J09]
MKEEYTLKSFIYDSLFILGYLFTVSLMSFVISFALIAAVINFTEITDTEPVMIVILAATAFAYSVFEFSRIYKEKWTPAIFIISIFVFASDVIQSNQSGKNKVEYNIEPAFQSAKFKNVLSNWQRARIH